MSPIKEVPRLFLTKHYTFHFKKVNFKVAITEMYPRISWELVGDPLGSTEHTLGTTVLTYSFSFTYYPCHKGEKVKPGNLRK